MSVKAILVEQQKGYTKAQEDTLLAQKQDTITVLPVVNGGTGNSSVDSTPTASSSKMVTSDGIYNAIQTRVPSNGLGENLLDNWYFVGGGSQQGSGIFPINQRGQTSYTAAGSIFDRWNKQRDNVGTVALTSSGVTITAPSNNSERISQTVDNVTKLHGKHLAMSVLLANGSLYKAGGTMPNSVPSSNTYIIDTTIEEDVGRMYVYYSSSGVFFVAVAANQGKSLTIAAVKLELGYEQTLAHQENDIWIINSLPDYCNEFNKCQRFLYLLPAYQGIRATTIQSDYIYFSFPIPQEMVKQPTIINDSYLAIQNLTGGSGITGFTFSIQAAAAKGSYIRIRAQKTSHGLSDAILSFGSTSPGVFLSAES